MSWQSPATGTSTRGSTAESDLVNRPAVALLQVSETKEQLGGILFLEARDLNHAIALMSKHPGVQFGPFEIRPADETINELVAARDAKVVIDVSS